MNEYQVIARKWRPQKFADVVGQDHLTRTLKNAIVQNRTAHAYLLVGPRGIGKTTTARILAKAFNCTNSQAGEPCCACESCKAIASDSSLDVIEIDAASQNSVDDIRQLCEQLTFAPVSSRYRIYIIDEVHMLSKQAWNAFLKTLEEPPAHVKFIFATTEVHKILPTILSRCQRFDLRRIPTHLIVERLALIAKSEGLTLSQTALEAIARAADGGMRDAQSLLDQLVTYFIGSDPSKPVNEEEVFTLFGLTSPQEMDTLLLAVLNDDRTGLVRSIYKLSQLGRNLETLLDELTEQLRALYIAMTVPEAAEILESTQETVNRLKTLGSHIAPQRISILLENLSQCEYGLRNALNKQVYLETTLLKAMRLGHAVSIDDVLSRLCQIREQGHLKPLEEIAFHPFAQRPCPQIEAGHGVENVLQDSPSPIQKTTIEKIDLGTDIPPTTWPLRQEKSVPTMHQNQEAQLKEQSFQVVSEDDETELNRSEEQRCAIQESSLDNPEETLSNIERINLNPHTLWRALIDDVSHHINNSILAQFMSEGIAKRIDEDGLHITFNDEFELDAFNKVKDAKQTLENCITRITHGDVRSLLLVHEHGISQLAVDQDNPVSKMHDYTQLLPVIENNSFVKEIRKHFGATIVDIHG